MADFYQDGVLTTLHRLAHDDVDRLEAELSRFVSNRPIGFVLETTKNWGGGARSEEHFVPSWQKTTSIRHTKKRLSAGPAEGR